MKIKRSLIKLLILGCATVSMASIQNMSAHAMENFPSKNNQNDDNINIFSMNKNDQNEDDTKNKKYDMLQKKRYNPDNMELEDDQSNNSLFDLNKDNQNNSSLFDLNKDENKIEKNNKEDDKEKNDLEQLDSNIKELIQELKVNDKNLEKEIFEIVKIGLNKFIGDSAKEISENLNDNEIKSCPDILKFLDNNFDINRENKKFEILDTTLCNDNNIKKSAQKLMDLVSEKFDLLRKKFNS